jgi:hypothetical protein
MNPTLVRDALAAFFAYRPTLNNAQGLGFDTDRAGAAFRAARESIQTAPTTRVDGAGFRRRFADSVGAEQAAAFLRHGEAIYENTAIPWNWVLIRLAEDRNLISDAHVSQFCRARIEPQIRDVRLPRSEIGTGPTDEIDGAINAWFGPDGAEVHLLLGIEGQRIATFLRTLDSACLGQLEVIAQHLNQAHGEPFGGPLPSADALLREWTIR